MTDTLAAGAASGARSESGRPGVCGWVFSGVMDKKKEGQPFRVGPLGGRGYITPCLVGASILYHNAAALSTTFRGLPFPGRFPLCLRGAPPPTGGRGVGSGLADTAPQVTERPRSGAEWPNGSAAVSARAGGCACCLFRLRWALPGRPAADGRLFSWPTPRPGGAHGSGGASPM